MTISIQKGRGIASQIVASVRSEIRSGGLSVGDALPSVRKLARELGIAPMTVVKAYAELRTSGEIEAVVGGKTRVAAPRTSVEGGLRLPTVHPLGEGPIDFRSGDVDPHLDALPRILRHLPGVLSPGTPDFQGNLRLRTALGRALGVSPDRLVTTLGRAHGLSLAIEALTLPGDRIAIETPSWPHALTWCREHRRMPVPISRSGGEIDLDALQAALRRGVQLVILTPGPSLATGDRLSEDNRSHVRGLLEEARATLIELHRASFPVESFGAARTVTLGSFSAEISAQLAPGYVIAAEETAFALAREKQQRLGHVQEWLEEAFAAWMESGEVPAQLEQATAANRAKLGTALSALESSMPSGVSWFEPESGNALWLRLPTGNFRDLETAAEVEGVLIRSGSVYVDRDGEQAIALSFGQATETQITEGIRRLAALVAERL